MEFIPRVRSAGIFPLIEQNLQITADWTKEHVIDSFTELLRNHPDSILISAVIDGEECVAFTISIAPPNAGFVVLAQAWAKSGIPEMYSKAGFGAVITWAQQLGKTAIRCETQRGDAMVRKWKFEHFAEVLSFDITNYDVRELFKENDNEQRRRNDINQHVEQGSVEGQQGVGGSGVGGSEIRDSAVLGADDGGSEPRVQADPVDAGSVQSEPELGSNPVGSLQSALGETSLQPGPESY